MTKNKYRMLALALASFTVIAGLAAYFTSSDTVTNSFRAATLEIRVEEPGWENNPTIVPEQKIEKDPYIVNTDETPAYVFMQVTVPVQEVTVEQNSANQDKGKVTTNATNRVPLFRFINSDGQYITDQFLPTQMYNNGWYAMPDYPVENKNSSGEIISYTYLYAWTGDNADDTMAVLLPKKKTTTPLFNKVIFCNAREDALLPGSIQNIKIEVFGIQADYLKSPTESESKAENVWKYLST